MINTDPPIQRQFTRITLRKEKILDILKAMTPDQYHQHTRPDQWTILQVANHLYLSEKSSLAYLRKKMSYPDTIPAYSISSWKTYYLVKLILNTPKKVKAPPPIDMWKQTDILEPSALEIKWNELQNELSVFLEENYPQFRSHLVFNHPFAGRMTMRQMLMFFCDHMDHHIRQMKRIRNEVKDELPFPGLRHPRE